MNIWENAVITNKGVALLTKMISGTTMNITRGEIGSGYVTPGTLANQTAVTNPMQEVSFREILYPEAGKCALPCFINNDKINAGYMAYQVGIYATDPDEGEILFFITQAPNGKGLEIPSATEMPGYSSEWTFYFQYGQADGVSVVVDPANSVSSEEMKSYVKNNAAPLRFDMTITYDEDPNKCSIDKTFAELQAAYEEGKQIRLVDVSGMEFELLAFRANYMAYFAHHLDSYRYLVCFRANGAVSLISDLQFSENNPPTADQVGAKKSNNVAITSGSIKTWAKEQKTSTSVGVYQNVTDMPQEGVYWVADLIVATSGSWRKLTVTKLNSNGSNPTTYECTCMGDNWSAWAKVYTEANKPTPEDIGAAKASDLSSHNTNTEAHSDLRAELQELSNWVKDLLDSDDETLNEMHEIVAYIKSNKSLIDAITISKVNVADIVNNLITNVTNKPLSAAQGVVLKGLIDTLQTAVNGKAPSSHKHTKSEITDFPTSMTPTAHKHSVADVTGAAKLQSPNDMLHNGNEFTFVPAGHSGELYINHRTASGATDGNISNYHFCDGKGGEATIIANYFKGKFQGKDARPIYNNEEVAMLSDVPSKTENWTFTLEDGSTVTKAVYIG